MTSPMLHLIAKSIGDHAEKIEAIVRDAVRDVIGAKSERHLTIVPVFPGATTGAEQGLLSIKVGGEYRPSQTEIEQLVSVLSARSELFEYVHVPQSREAMGAPDRQTRPRRAG